MKIFTIAFISIFFFGCASFDHKTDKVIDQECAIKNSVESIHDKIE